MTSTSTCRIMRFIDWPYRMCHADSSRIVLELALGSSSSWRDRETNTQETPVYCFGCPGSDALRVAYGTLSRVMSLFGKLTMDTDRTGCMELRRHGALRRLMVGCAWKEDIPVKRKKALHHMTSRTRGIVLKDMDRL